ncbi:MAG: ATP-binding protein [candidate division WOR-3 bacterium]
MIFSYKPKEIKNVFYEEKIDYALFIKHLYNILKRIYLLDSENREKKLRFFLKRLEIFSEILEGKVVTEFKEIEPGKFIQNVISEIKNTEDIKFIDFEISLQEDFTFVSEPEILKFILIEILRNSIWACKGQGKIKVSFKKNEYNVYIEIEDSGIGINRDIKEKIFLPFTQFNERFYNGFGLGLPIIKGLSKFIACNIEVDTRLSSGCVFRLILPLNLKVRKGNL